MQRLNCINNKTVPFPLFHTSACYTPKKAEFQKAKVILRCLNFPPGLDTTEVIILVADYISK